MKKIISLVCVLLLANVVCFAQIKNYKVESSMDIPSNKSQDEIVSSLIKNLTKQAIEKSGIKLNEYKLSDREYNDFLRDVTKVEVKNKKVFMKKDNLQCVNIKLNVAMDVDVAKTYLSKVKENKEKNKKQEVVNLSSSTVDTSSKKINTDNLNVSTAVANTVNKVKQEISSSTIKPQNLVSNNVKVSTMVNTSNNKTTEKISINKALQEAKSLKQEVKLLLDKFDNSLKESNDEIIKSYNDKISKINLNLKKDKWETTEQYEERIDKNKQEKQILEQEKQKVMSEDEIKIAQMAVTTLKPKINKLQSFQTERFADENSVNAKVVSLGEVNADEKYFVMKIFYENEQSMISNLVYDFSDVDIQQAKAMYENYNRFLIEPLYSVEESENGDVQKILTAFNVKYVGTTKEKIVKVSVMVKQFNEIRRFEKYNNILNKNIGK